MEYNARNIMPVVLWNIVHTDLPSQTYAQYSMEYLAYPLTFPNIRPIFYGISCIPTYLSKHTPNILWNIVHTHLPFQTYDPYPMGYGAYPLRFPSIRPIYYGTWCIPTYLPKHTPNILWNIVHTHLPFQTYDPYPMGYGAYPLRFPSIRPIYYGTWCIPSYLPKHTPNILWNIMHTRLSSLTYGPYPMGHGAYPLTFPNIRPIFYGIWCILIYVP